MFLAFCLVIKDITVQNILGKFAEMADDTSLEDVFIEFFLSHPIVLELTHSTKYYKHLFTDNI